MDKKEVRRQQLDQAVHLTGYDAIYGHARFVAAFRGTAGGVLPVWAGYEILEGAKVAVDGLKSKVDGAVPIKWARNQQSCLISFGPILAEHERLGVEFGRIRRIPFAVEEGRLILDLTEGDLDDSTPRKRRMAARARWDTLTKEEQQAAFAKELKKRLRMKVGRMKR